LKNRLLLLNLALIALICGAGWRLRQNWLEARAREQQMFGRTFKPLPAPVLPPFVTTPAVAAANYLEVAEKMLFSKDRNPVVIVDPPPAKPMPPLPVFHGVMDLGKGPTVILSNKSGAAHRGYQPGEQIGEFTVAGITSDGIDFEWDGKPVHRSFDELADRSPQPAAASPPSMVAQAGATANTTTDLSKSSVISGGTKSGPGPGQAGEVRPCQVGDDSDAGTVTDGYKKVVSRTPFGSVCRWEPVN
jgi:hypothetical protein